jgi:hypothetical protein
MNQQQATDFIIRLLNQGYACDQIVEEICAQTSWPARQVEPFVRKVEAQVTAAPVAAMPARAAETSWSQATPAQRPPARQSPDSEIEPAEKVVQFVISQLGRHHSRNDIIQRLCEQEGWPWKQAERFVRKVEIQHHHKIAARQSPIIIFLGVGSLIAGAVIVVFTGVSLVEWVNHPSVTNPEQVENSPYYVAAFVTGLGMVIGGIAGIWRAVSSIRE